MNPNYVEDWAGNYWQHFVNTFVNRRKTVDGVVLLLSICNGFMTSANNGFGSSPMSSARIQELNKLLFSLELLGFEPSGLSVNHAIFVKKPDYTVIPLCWIAHYSGLRKEPPQRFSVFQTYLFCRSSKSCKSFFRRCVRPFLWWYWYSHRHGGQKKSHHYILWWLWSLQLGGSQACKYSTGQPRCTACISGRDGLSPNNSGSTE